MTYPAKDLTPDHEGPHSVTTYTLRKGAADKTRTDVVVIGVVTGPKGLKAAPGGEAVASAYGRKFLPLMSTLGFSGKPGETVQIPTNGTLKSPLLMLVGLGDGAKLTSEALRRAAGVAARSVSNAASVTLALPAEDADQVAAVVEGYVLGGYRFDTYRTKKAEGRPGDVVVLSDAARNEAAKQAVETAEVVAAAKALARDWVNTPAADLTPAAFADAVEAANKARKGGGGKIKVEVLDDKELLAGGYGGIIGVGQGSDSPPRLVKLSYSPRGAKRHLALVGKGITYDSGGLSIKPGGSMATMKCDMGGAAAVVTATFAIADLGLPIAVTTYAPMAENMLSGAATRPGDVLTMYGGKTVEVLNTDAEGRLVLADALVAATKQKPDLIVDVATLTGACEIALGDRIAGVLGNDKDLIARTLAAGERTGEGLWELPIPEQMTEKVRTQSKIADLMQHNIDRWGGALFAAAFLQEFVDGTDWVHLDIAGPAFNERGPYGYTPSGGTGFGVSTLVELARDLSG